MKKTYLTPDLEVLVFVCEDVLAESLSDGTIIDGSNDLTFGDIFGGN